jgi:small subunit ribosomal protein S13
MADAKEGKPQQEKKEEKKPSAQNPQRAQVSSIVRISGKDVNGSLNMERALYMVKGIGGNLSRILAMVIESKLGIPRSTNIGSLTEEQVISVEQIIKSPAQYGVPSYMLNRNKDMDTGAVVSHNVGTDLMFATRQDVGRDLTLRDYRGFRHQYGQKARGQHTRSTGRTGATVGVTKKAVREAQKAAKSGAPAEKEKKPAEAAPKK